MTPRNGNWTADVSKNRRLCLDRRLHHGGLGRARRVNRLAMLAAFRLRRLFRGLLGTPDNGRWLIGAADPDAKVTRLYRGRTLTLETLIETKDGAAIVQDFMPTKIRGSHIVRLVRGIKGTVRFRTELIIRFDYGAIVPWVRRHDDGSLHAVAGPIALSCGRRLPCSLAAGPMLQNFKSPKARRSISL